MRLGEALLRAYDARKRLRALLDYDDLVLRRCALLRRPGVAPWVLFKLDGGLDHILIDEAQDTNPEQWEIVAVLAEEFFAGEGARGRDAHGLRGRRRQAVDLQLSARRPARLLATCGAHFQQRVAEAKQDWRIVPLDISFRSTEPVLRGGRRRLSPARGAATGWRSTAPRSATSPPAAGQAGLVELWPPSSGRARGRTRRRRIARRPQRVAEPHARLARAIAATINGLARPPASASPARDRPIRAGDIMVLVRRRNEFVGELLRALKERGVPVAGADRMVLAEHWRCRTSSRSASSCCCPRTI